MARSASLGTSVPVLAVVNGVPTTTTLDIARVYGSRHGNVLRIVRQRMAECSPDWRLLNFEEASIEIPQTNGGTVSYPVIRMTRKGFQVVVGKFTGAKAVQHQIAFADEFERMEAELAQRPQALAAVPEIDVAALLLSGQSDPVPLTPAQYRLVDQRAYALSADAHALIREHLLRAIAHRATWNDRQDPANTGIAALLDSITLGRALTLHHVDQTYAAVALLAGAHDLIGQAHARLQADLKSAGQPAHARH